MKRIYVCIGIVVLLLAAAFYSSFRVQQFAEDISDDIDTAMLKPGLVAHVQGRRVLALDGFEAALTDKAAKQRMWAYIKQLTPAAAPL